MLQKHQGAIHICALQLNALFPSYSIAEWKKLITNQLDKVNDKTQINDIVQIELPGQEELLYKNYHQTQDGVQQAYYVSHFLGRLYTLQEIFPDYFTDEWIEAYPLFENNEWMYKWYLFLKKNADLKSAFENFDEMKKILRQNFSWI